MSFGSTGFGGFGASNNNNNQSSGFGGFGGAATNNTSGGFGSSGFGASTNNNTGGSLFGGGATNTATSGFGGSGGFGAPAATTSPFGAKPAFGAPAANSGGSLFGGTASNTSSGGFGGFGSTNNNNTTTNSGFGASTGGFGSNTATSGFGGTTTGGGGLFGNNNNNSTASTGFGGTGTTGGFGQAASTGFGTTNNNANAQNTGTGSTPFTEHNEKDQTQNNKYQSIVCLPAYQNWSFEELRTVDYAQGRKTGNSNGQAGAFGTSTGFGGGFGSTNNASSGGFGTTTNNTSGGFGSTANTGNSIFGGAKPNPFGTPAATASGGFGSTANTTGGGLFGQPANNTASTGFGGNTNSGFGSTTSGGLFGNKPATTGGMFGSTPAATSNTGGIFGNTTNTTGGGFGAGSGGFGSTNTNTSGGFGQPAANNNTGGIFGNSANNNSSTGSGFGGGFGTNNQTNNQTQNANPFGGFNNNNANQNKTPFGATTNTTASLFGQPAATQQTNSLFGNTQTNNTQGNSLFGPKPATTGSSLFGSAQTSNTGGGMFGSTQNNNNNQSSSLFAPKPTTTGGGLFGNTTNNNSGNSIFGNSLGGNNNNNQQQSGGMFGNTQNQQSSFGGNSMFGGSIAGQQQQPQQLSTSIMANNPYGNEHLFANLGSPQQAVGPLATPLSSSQKARKPAPLPTYKLNPSASSRLITPQKRSGYGFEYSNYGTPGSAYSNASSPMYGGSLLSNSRLGSTLTRSLSSSTLGRSSISPSESILNPNAFSSGGLRGSTGGSLKKLRINRNLRTDLFGTAESAPESRTSPLKKTVTFGGEEHENGTSNGETSNALVRVQSDGESSMPSAAEQGYLRSNGSRPAPRSNGSSGQPEMQQVNGKELAVVPENASLPSSALAKTSSPASVPMSQEDQIPGEYFTIPGLDEISKMSRQDKSKIKSFIVGREGCGQIEFHDVDLTAVDLDDIIGDIVRIETRSATVYVDHSDKPPVGKGLNTRSTVTLKNSWPRTKGGKQQVLERKGPRFEKHLQRLQRVQDTEFVEYRAETGEWVFAVDHFSTYALDYSDDIDSIMSSPVRTPAAEVVQDPHEDTSMVSNASSAQDSNVDDTFEFRSSRALPGAFDDDAGMYDDMIGNSVVQNEQHNVDSDDEGVVQGHGMTGRRDSSVFDDTAPMEEHDKTSFEKHSPNFATSLKPKSILKTSTGFRTSFGGTPSRKPVIGADWATQLQRTISPKKQDRQALRESQGIFANAPFAQSTRARPQVNFASSTKPTNEPKIGNSIDLMNSLFGNSTTRTAPIGAQQSARSNGFQWPYAKRPDVDDNSASKEDKNFHDSFKPSWTADGMLVLASARSPMDGALVKSLAPVFGESKDVHFARLSSDDENTSFMLKKQQDISQISVEAGAPLAQLQSDVTFAEMASAVLGNTVAAHHERATWKLASILFDPIQSGGDEQARRKAHLATFWKDLTNVSANMHVESTSSAEEQALAQLSTNDIWAASETLSNARDFRLATLIAQLGTDSSTRESMAEQIKHWRETDVAAEMTPEIRALYELIAGNTCISDGKGGSVGRENRAETFNISSKFGLDWKQAFGLKLWYGITSEQSLAAAIEAYENDLASGNEKVRPVPFFTEDVSNSNGWLDGNSQQREDIFWGLLKLYASTQSSSVKANLGDILTPENLTGNPINARLCFQLYQLLRAKGIADLAGASSTTSFSSNDANDDADEQDDHGSDILTSLLVAQLSTTPSHLVQAVFTAAHLRDATSRTSTIRALLTRHASALGNDSVFGILATDLRILESWLHTSLAQHARSVLSDFTAEISHLLRAGELVEAHTRLRTSVAPNMVIEEDVDGLRELLAECNRFGVNEVHGWNEGGGLYADFIELDRKISAGEDEGKEELVTRLEAALRQVASGKMGLEERVARAEIGSLVAEERRTMGNAMRKSKGGVVGDEVMARAMKLSESFYARVGGIGVGA